MFFGKATMLALRLGGSRGLEGPKFWAAMSSREYSGDSSYLVSAYQSVRLDLSAASSSTLDAVLLSEETERPLHVGNVVQTAEWTESVEGEGRSGNVSLHSTMQSNVPEPYVGRNRSPSHLNMPRGIVGRQQQRRFQSGDRIIVRDFGSSVGTRSTD